MRPMPMDLTGDCDQIGVPFAQRQVLLLVPIGGEPHASGSVAPCEDQFRP